jgi:glucan phosphoethanolaminetransferase (alkaline phosphatase superfamily)
MLWGISTFQFSSSGWCSWRQFQMSNLLLNSFMFSLVLFFFFLHLASWFKNLFSYKDDNVIRYLMTTFSLRFHFLLLLFLCFLINQCLQTLFQLYFELIHICSIFICVLFVLSFFFNPFADFSSIFLLNIMSSCLWILFHLSLFLLKQERKTRGSKKETKVRNCMSSTDIAKQPR